MRKRSEIGAKPKKSSAAERTEPLVRRAAVTDAIVCQDCEEITVAGEASKRSDGTLECGSCGAPLHAMLVREDGSGSASKPKPTPDPTPAPKRDPGASSKDSDPTTRLGPAEPERKPTLPKVYCNECGTEWLRVNDRPMPNCGHSDGFVDDPSKARNYNPPAGHPRSDIRMKTVTETQAPTTEVKVQGNMVYVAWGKAMFRVSDYSTFTVGPFSMSAAIKEGEDSAKLAASMLVKLRTIACDAYELTSSWYLERLGRLQG